MKRKTIVVFLALLTGCLGSLHSQHYTSSNSKAVKLYEKGRTALYRSNGEEAVKSFKQALEADPSFVECHIMLAEWSLDAGDSNSAKQHYYAATAINETFFTKAWLTIGDLELASGNYDKAGEAYNKYILLDNKEAMRAEYGKKCAAFRRTATANPVPFAPQNMGANINSKDNEYLPALTVDGSTLIFTRRGPRRATTTANTAEEEDFFTSTLVNGQWTKAVRMSEPVNSNDNEGAQCISQDGRIMFFTGCERQDGAGRCDLYMCVKRGDKWGKPRNLGPAVNSRAWESQPSFSIDGKTLYFVSDRKGGYGGMDIWTTHFENGQWAEPTNLGPQINTSGNDMSPFIHFDDQTLYFCSDGHVGMGGTDIFVSHRQPDGSWSEAENIGFPINTAGDESSLVVSADARTAYFSSNRPGGYGKLDIYSFELPAQARPTAAVCLRGRVTNAKTGTPVAADIKIIDLANGTVVSNTSSDANTGSYMATLPTNRDYAFHVSSKGFLFHSRNESLKNISDNEWSPSDVDIALQPIETGTRLALRNVFFETGHYDILENSAYELDKVVELLANNQSLRIEIGGHTDNVGRSESNQRLSEQRAQAVYQYLTNKGIDASRLTYRGYGDTQPITTNDTPEGRAQNRRTEMKIL